MVQPIHPADTTLMGGMISSSMLSAIPNSTVVGRKVDVSSSPEILEDSMGHSRKVSFNPQTTSQPSGKTRISSATVKQAQKMAKKNSDLKPNQETRY
jgi:hypothetical protein